MIFRGGLWQPECLYTIGDMVKFHILSKVPKITRCFDSKAFKL